MSQNEVHSRPWRAQINVLISSKAYMGNSTLVIPQRPFLNIAANAPTANNDTSSDSSHRREYL